MIDYVELHCHSFFSLLDGASSPEALVERAAVLGMDALALTDHDAVYGAPRFAAAAATHDIHPIFGAELTVDDHHLTLLVEDAQGWSNLCWLITQARHSAPKGEARLAAELLDGHTAGLIALSGCRRGAVAAALLRRDEQAALEAARHYQVLFGPGSFFIELQHQLQPEDGALVDALAELAARLNLETVATNNVHYAARTGHRLQDVLVGIRHNLPLDDNPHLRGNSENYLKSPRRMAQLFAAHPGGARSDGADRRALPLRPARRLAGTAPPSRRPTAATPSSTCTRCVRRG